MVAGAENRGHVEQFIGVVGRQSEDTEWLRSHGGGVTFPLGSVRRRAWGHPQIQRWLGVGWAASESATRVERGWRGIGGDGGEGQGVV